MKTACIYPFLCADFSDSALARPGHLFVPGTSAAHMGLMSQQNHDELTDPERKAISSLQRLARKWPRSLTLVSMGGALAVIRTGDPRFLEDGPLERHEAILEDINGIPNTGGDW